MTRGNNITNRGRKDGEWPNMLKFNITLEKKSNNKGEKIFEHDVTIKYNELGKNRFR